MFYICNYWTCVHLRVDLTLLYIKLYQCITFDKPCKKLPSVKAALHQHSQEHLFWVWGCAMSPLHTGQQKHCRQLIDPAPSGVARQRGPWKDSDKEASHTSKCLCFRNSFQYGHPSPAAAERGLLYGHRCWLQCWSTKW